jgi:RNA polymerase primary sigma factor
MANTIAKTRKRTRAGKPAASAALRRRAADLLETEFEYVFSPEFDRPGAGETILGEPPAYESATVTVTPPADAPPYLAELYRFPLLTREQEHHWFRKMNYLKYRADRLRRKLSLKSPRKDRIVEIERLRDEALAVRNHLVNSNLRLVVAIAKKLVDGANSLDDLISDGNLPLIRAVEIFDFNRGTRFSTYATWAVRNGLFRTSKRNRRLHGRQRLQAEDWLEAVPDENGAVSEDDAVQKELRDGLKKGLKRLKPRDRRIVAARFGLGKAQEPRKFREIAADLNLSTERVRQLLARSLTRLETTVDPCLADVPQQAI